MLWYKSWLETRWRFVIGLALLVMAIGAVFTMPLTGLILSRFGSRLTTAVLGMVVAWHVRPVPVPALTGAVAAVVTLLVAFGVPAVPAGTVSAVNAALVAVLALFRGHVTPVAGAPVASPGLPTV